MMLAERGWFLLCLGVGRVLRIARYSKVRIIERDSGEVRKSRRFYAPLLLWMGGLLMRFLDTGVRILRQREWEEREREMYRKLRGASIRIDAGGTLVLPCLAGRTLATWLEDPELEESVRTRAIQLAAASLADFHAQGFTHGDAMAENVMVDLEAGIARWFDFETVHDSNRPLAWRRADDLRAFIATCILRTDRTMVADTLALVLDAYRDEEVLDILSVSFASVWRRPLIFHLAQAGLSFQRFREIGRVLRERRIIWRRDG